MTRYAGPYKRRHNGQAIVLVALAVVALFAFVGLAVDGGYTFAQRRWMQNAADAAALAGARELLLYTELGEPKTNQDIYNRISEYLAKNRAICALDPCNYSFVAQYYPGKQLLTQDNASPPAGATGVYVTAKVERPTLFLRALRLDTMAVAATACAAGIAKCGGGYAIWADAPNCSQNELAVSGSSVSIQGDVHSNGEVKSTGQSTVVDGHVTYTTPTPQGNISYTPVAGNPAQDSIRPLPVTYNLDDYRCTPTCGTYAAAAIAAGKYRSYTGNFNWNPNNIPDPLVFDGLYYIDGNISLSGFDNLSDPTDPTKPFRITIVATGTIAVTNGSGQKLAPSQYADGLLLFSNQNVGSPKCSPWVINISGSDNNWGGVIYAPYGLVNVQGATNFSIGGSIIAYSVSLQGSGINIRYDEQFCSDASRLKKVRLIKVT